MSSKALVQITVDLTTEREAVGEGDTAGDEGERSGVLGSVVAGDVVADLGGYLGAGLRGAGLDTSCDGS